MAKIFRKETFVTTGEQDIIMQLNFHVDGHYKFFRALALATGLRLEQPSQWFPKFEPEITANYERILHT